MNDVIKNYKIYLTPLTPIHIGNGQELLPYEYVIHKGYLYKFNSVEVYDNLSKKDKEIFTKYAEESLITLRSFISEIFDESLGFISKIEVSQNFLENYQKKIKGAKNSNEENSFAINDFINVYDKAYIAGSTVKGAIRGSYLYYLGESKKIFDYKIVKGFRGRIDKKRSESFKAKVYENKLLQKTTPLDDPFKILKIKDSFLAHNVLRVYDINVFTYKRKKDRFVKGVPYYALCTKSKISTNDNIKFEMQMTISDECFFVEGVKILITKEDILKSLNKKAKYIIENELKFFDKKSKYYATWNVYNKINNIYNELDKNNEALIRIGRGCGFDSVTFNLANKGRSERTDPVSRSLAENIYPLGWAVIKIV